MSAEPEKLGVIYNPKAGTRKVQKRWKEIKEYMEQEYQLCGCELLPFALC